MEDALKAEGWHLSPDGLKTCQECCSKAKPTVKDLINEALQLDLRQIGKAVLPESINRGQLSEVNGPMVLQIQKVRNISAPKANEESQFAPRLLRLLLTDGVTNCPSLELEQIPSISLASPPGSKICLRGAIPVQNGFLLLSSTSVKFLGGQVEKLKAKWEISKNVGKIQRKVGSDAGGPPPFVPFEQRERGKTNQPSTRPEKGKPKESDAPTKVDQSTRSESKNSDGEYRMKGGQSTNKRERGNTQRPESSGKSAPKVEHRVDDEFARHSDRGATPSSKQNDAFEQSSRTNRRANESSRHVEYNETLDSRQRPDKRDAENKRPSNSNENRSSSSQKVAERRTESKPFPDRKNEKMEKTSQNVASGKRREGGYERSHEESYDRRDSYTHRRREQNSYDNRGPPRRRSDAYNDDRHYNRSHGGERAPREDRSRRQDNNGDRYTNGRGYGTNDRNYGGNERQYGKGRYNAHDSETTEYSRVKYSPTPDKYGADDRGYRRGERGSEKWRDDRKPKEGTRYSQTNGGRGKSYSQESKEMRNSVGSKSYDRSRDGKKWENDRDGGSNRDKKVTAETTEKDHNEEVPVESFNRRIDLRQGSEDSSASGRTSDGTLGSAGDLEPDRIPSHDRRRNYEHRHNHKPFFELPPRYENLKNQRKKNIEQLEGAIRVEDLEAEEVEETPDSPKPEPEETVYEYPVSEEPMAPTFVPVYPPQVFMRMNAAPVENQYTPVFMGMNTNQPQPYGNNYYMAPRIIPDGQYYYTPNQPPYPMNTYIQQPPPPQPAPMAGPGPIAMIQAPRRSYRRHDVHRPK